jgi:cystathionine beta-lyase/cystathionine gamma-synthase
MTDDLKPATNPPTGGACPADLEVAALMKSQAYPARNIPQAEALELSSVWQLESPAAADAAMRGEGQQFVYRRVEHPNAQLLASKLALMHGAPKAVLTAQGMSAIAAVALANLKPGSQVWIGNELYGETSQLLCRNLAQWGVEVSLFDPCADEDLSRLSRANTVDLVFIETITNPRMRVADIRKVAAATHRAGGRLVVDNTFATCLLCRPLELGADFVVESLGKIVNGHSDGMLGLIVGRDSQAISQLASWVKTFGWTSSPMDCYLTHRGLQSLALRLNRACDNAMALAHCLSQIEGVMRVDYPGLPTSSSHLVAQQQFQLAYGQMAYGQLAYGQLAYGWMLGFQIEADPQLVERLFGALRPEFCFVPSLGDANTTLSHPVSTSHRATDTTQLQQLGIDHGTLRVSCGLEPTEWLLARFRSAMHDCQLK